jgi:hypothetical protein
MRQSGRETEKVLLEKLCTFGAAQVGLVAEKRHIRYWDGVDGQEVALGIYEAQNPSLSMSVALGLLLVLPLRRVNWGSRSGRDRRSRRAG